MIDKFSKMPYIENKEFYSKIFTDKEIEYCMKFNDPYPHFAGKFALKEAVIKVIKKTVSFKEIEILHGKFNEPKISCPLSNLNLEASLSHEDRFAIGVVISSS